MPTLANHPKSRRAPRPVERPARARPARAQASHAPGDDPARREILAALERIRQIVDKSGVRRLSFDEINAMLDEDA